MPSLVDQALERVSTLPSRIKTWYINMNRTAKLVFWIYFITHLGMVVAVNVIGTERFFAMMAEWAEGLKEMELGWLLLYGLIILTSFPPLFGYGTTISMCGFAFGVRNGWLLACAGCLTGSALAFIVTRRLIKLFAPLLATQPTFKLTMQYVAEIPPDDIEANLLNDVETMLYEEEHSSSSEHLPTPEEGEGETIVLAPRTAPTPSTPTPKPVAPPVSRTLVDIDEQPRPSEDGWGGSMSDFSNDGLDVEEGEDHVSDADLLGLGDTTPTRPRMDHFASSDTVVGRDKRMD
ncbi:SNARE associated Golgi protein [Pseudohyphozyma bogoriensis]|nr:SNARE associated Golgi protein [Pseudohyphozyma bogoriensis]